MNHIHPYAISAYDMRESYESLFGYVMVIKKLL